MSGINLGDQVAVSEKRRIVDAQGLEVGGYVIAEAKDKRTGELQWREEGPNLVTTVGKNYLCNVALDAVTQITSWYIGLYNNTYTPDAAHTITNITASEFSSYTGDRKLYDPTPATTGSITAVTNTSDFDISASGTLGGVFLYSSATATTGGTVFAIKDFASDRAVDGTTVLQITYLLTLT